MIHHSAISFNAHMTYPTTRATLTRNPRTCLNIQSLRWHYVGSPRGGLSSSFFVRRCATLDTDLGLHKGTKMFHEIELEVRDYELDLHGFVKDAVYANCCQYCCRKFLERIGVCFSTEVELAGKAFAFTNISMKIHSHLRNQVKFVVMTRVYEASAVRMFFELFIFEKASEKLLGEIKATLIWLDQKHHRPVRIPLDVRYKIDRYILSGEQRND